MNYQEERNFSYRVYFVLLILFGGLAIVGVRAFKLQVIQHERLANFAREEYLKDLRIPAHRGNIYDRNGKPLAIAVEVPSLYANPKEIQDPYVTARLLAKHLSLKVEKLYEKLTTPRFFVWLERRIDKEVAQKVQALALPGIYMTPELKRFYPHRELAAQVLGFVGIDAYGLEGLEKQYNDLLKGETKMMLTLRDAHGREVLADSPSLRLEQQNQGSSLILTLDAVIQHKAEEALLQVVESTKAKAALAIVLDVDTAEILALAVVPTFNPNSAAKFVPDRRRNRALADIFEPGSTLKPLVVAAALEQGAIRPHSKFFCENGSYQIGKHTIHDTSPHGLLTLEQIIAKSSNIGMAKIGEALGRERLYKALREYGFGAVTGSGFPGEVAGLLPASASWSEVGLANIAFGHGIAVNALQMVAAYRVLVADGYYLAPTFVKAIKRLDGTKLDLPQREPKKVLSGATVRRVLPMLETAVSTEGTGSRAAVEGYRVGGKTGTSQKIDPETRTYSKKHFVTSFIGFLPFESPKVITIVVIDEPKTEHLGGLVAAPVFARIGSIAMHQLGVIPK